MKPRVRSVRLLLRKLSTLPKYQAEDDLLGPITADFRSGQTLGYVLKEPDLNGRLGS